MSDIEKLVKDLSDVETQVDKLHATARKLRTEIRLAKGCVGDLHVGDKFKLYSSEYEMLGTGSMSDLNQNPRRISDVHQEIRNLVNADNCIWAFTREEDGKPRIVLIRSDTQVQ